MARGRGRPRKPPAQKFLPSVSSSKASSSSSVHPHAHEQTKTPSTQHPDPTILENEILSPITTEPVASRDPEHHTTRFGNISNVGHLSAATSKPADQAGLLTYDAAISGHNDDSCRLGVLRKWIPKTSQTYVQIDSASSPKSQLSKLTTTPNMPVDKEGFQ
ncbi:unnamed protein product [Amaranthus hypochondriacus]